MNNEIIVERLFEKLITGDRTATRAIVQETIDDGVSPEELSQAVYWPALEMINSLYRADQLSTLAHHYGTRLLRSLVDQAQARYTQKPSRDRTILMFSGPGEADELAGQLVADLAEANGYEVFFGGGGVANDEILAEVGARSPDILLLFASAPSDAPNVRRLIDTIQEIGATPSLQIVVGGGVFNRAEGLAEEIGADLWSNDPADLLEKLASEPNRRATPDQRTVGRHRRNKSAAA
ncbi:MAG: cobalamin-dependent protein [Planctomycetes bacterium]|nr:cobalamin-dependent protein [Planctomycetota bacterium]